MLFHLIINYIRIVSNDRFWRLLVKCSRSFPFFRHLESKRKIQSTTSKNISFKQNYLATACRLFLRLVLRLILRLVLRLLLLCCFLSLFVGYFPHLGLYIGSCNFRYLIECKAVHVLQGAHLNIVLPWSIWLHNEKFVIVSKIK